MSDEFYRIVSEQASDPDFARLLHSSEGTLAPRDDKEETEDEPKLLLSISLLPNGRYAVAIAESAPPEVLLSILRQIESNLLDEDD